MNLRPMRRVPVPLYDEPLEISKENLYPAHPNHLLPYERAAPEPEAKLEFRPF